MSLDIFSSIDCPKGCLRFNSSTPTTLQWNGIQTWWQCPICGTHWNFTELRQVLKIK